MVTRISKYLILLVFLICYGIGVKAQKDQSVTPSFEVDLPELIVQNIAVSLDIFITDPEIQTIDTSLVILVNGKQEILHFQNGATQLQYTFERNETVQIIYDSETFEKHITPIPLWTSILPPLIAILFALLFKEVFSALFIGLWVGTSIITYYQGNNLLIAIFKGMYLIIDTYILESVSDKGHLSIIVFSMLIGAMVHLITANGGTKGVVNYLSRFANNPRSGQFITWLLGIMIFFDDYANTLVVGNTMRPVTDRLKISREKLAYIVDSTAAPIAAVAFVTTWIGAELSYIQDGIDVIGIDESAYNVFLNSLAYSFYPVFTLIFILFLVFRRVDYGPMLYAERKARKEGVISQNPGNSMIKDPMAKMDNFPGNKARWYNAVVPVLIIVLGTFSGLIYTGWDPGVWGQDDLSFSTKLSATIGNSDSYKALLWSSISGVIAALVLTLSQRILTLKKSIESLMDGFKTMLTAVFILTLAWSIALVTNHMHTAEFISNSMLSISISPFFVPAITFILAALVSFATGSSWGTMAILYPLLLPTTWLISTEFGLPYEKSISIFYNVVSGVLAGSVLGDHCSPISDTTILSSLASSCNHIEHVRTQLPYAVTVGLVAVGAGTIPTAFGVPSYVSFIIGITSLFLIVIVLGKKISPVSSINPDPG